MKLFDCGKHPGAEPLCMTCADEAVDQLLETKVKAIMLKRNALKTERDCYRAALEMILDCGHDPRCSHLLGGSHCNCHYSPAEKALKPPGPGKEVGEP